MHNSISQKWIGRKLSLFGAILLMCLCSCESDTSPGSDVPIGNVEWSPGGTTRVSYWIWGNEQRASNWCWAACIETVTNSLLGTHFTPVISQEMIVGNASVEGDRRASCQEIAQSLNSRRFRRPFPVGLGYIDYVFQAYTYNGLPTVGQLDKLVRGDGAVILAINLDSPHAVVLESFEWEERVGDKRISKIDVWDPWPRRGRRSIRPDQVCGCIVVRVIEQPGTRDQ